MKSRLFHCQRDDHAADEEEVRLLEEFTRRQMKEMKTFKYCVHVSSTLSTSSRGKSAIGMKEVAAMGIASLTQ